MVHSVDASRAGALLTVDLGAVRANYRALANKTAGACAAVMKADAYGLGMEQVAPALALGSYSRLLLKDQFQLPVYPLKGYSITVPITDAARAPVSTILDESYKIAVTRFEDRIRVGGMAEIAGYSKVLNRARRATLEMVVNDLFPGAGDTSQASFWTGLRPMTPDSTPVVGATPLRNLFVNTGHGTLGWTMACGSAAVIADLVSGKKPAIRADDLAVFRYAGTPQGSAAPELVKA